jgi:hypothetical protein
MISLAHNLWNKCVTLSCQALWVTVSCKVSFKHVIKYELFVEVIINHICVIGQKITHMPGNEMRNKMYLLWELWHKVIRYRR